MYLYVYVIYEVFQNNVTILYIFLKKYFFLSTLDSRSIYSFDRKFVKESFLSFEIFLVKCVIFKKNAEKCRKENFLHEYTYFKKFKL